MGTKLRVPRKFKYPTIGAGIGSLLGMGPVGLITGGLYGDVSASKREAEIESNEVRQELEQKRIEGVMASFRQEQQKLDLTLGAGGSERTRRVSTPALSGESLGSAQDQDDGTVMGDLFGQKQSSVSGTF